MGYGDNSMTVECDTKEVLGILRRNLESHKTIVAEARKGYLDKARTSVAAALARLEKGEILALNFGLSLPEDRTADYRTAIRMLELHKGETISLDTENVQKFVEDRWEWKRRFLSSNAMYSETATRMLGAEADEE